MIYSLNYKTTNHYSRHTHQVFLEYLVLPERSKTQEILNYSIDTLPSTPTTMGINRYGFPVVQCLHIGSVEKFTLVMMCRISLHETEVVAGSKLSARKENDVLTTPGFHRKNYFWLKQTPLTAFSPTLPRTIGEPVFDFCTRLMQHLTDTIEYQPGVSDATTSASKALAAGRGVCQDYAHIFIGHCRDAGIPARYVSGYLHTGEAALAQLHAWSEILIPGIGWVGIDPSNHLFVNENYIKIAHGTDYSECASLKGVIRGGSGNTTSYEVSIQQQNQ